VSKEWLILAFVGAGLGLWRSFRLRDATLLERVAFVTLPPLLVAVLWLYVETAGLNTRWTWSACRLAPVVGWLQGYPLYSPEDHGPINGWLYGPVAALAWLPATLARSPEPALFIAAAINLAFLLIPLAAAARRAAPDSWTGAGLAFTAAAAGLLQLYPTWYMASALNVDAIAVGLGLGSCVLLLGPSLTRRRLALAATLSALAVWTKQVEAPLVFAQLGWLALARDRRAALTFGLAFAGVMLIVGLLMVTLFEARAVFFNLWTVPAHHPLLGGWAAARGELFDLARYAFPLWAACAVGLALERRRPATGAPAPSGATLLVAAAVVLLPTGIMATIKLGGDRNSLHSVYYLLAATLLVVATLHRQLPSVRPLRLALLLPLAALLAGLSIRQVAGYPGLAMLPPRCLSQEAWVFAREQPGRVYFPWDPLATLMAERRAYHFEYGVYDRVIAGSEPTAAHLAAGVPEKSELVVYPKADYSRLMLRSLPGYTLSATTDDWLIYRPAPPPR
jgi:hypothetical protein